MRLEVPVIFAAAVDGYAFRFLGGCHGGGCGCGVLMKMMKMMDDDDDEDYG